MRRVLVVGGAGYIGAHMVKRLHGAGIEPVVLDNLSTGWRSAVRYGRLVEGDACDGGLVDRLLGERIDGVVHFAAYSQVGESVRAPAEYYRNNVVCTQTLLDAMVRRGVSCLVYSSSAAVYGDPRYLPIDEHHPLRPLSPYGHSKLMAEQMAADYERAYGLRTISLRYFNAAGADPDGELGEHHEPETHLIPSALRAASGRRPSITVHGSAYDTPDGTCIRDYVHVHDLCEAHLLALEALWNGESAERVYNLGSSVGVSVNEVIETVERVTGVAVPAAHGDPRPGDPARLVAEASRARTSLGWRPRYDLDAMVEHAWRWEKSSCSGA